MTPPTLSYDDRRLAAVLLRCATCRLLFYTLSIREPFTCVPCRAAEAKAAAREAEGR